jgi:hypothetical protein
MEEERARQEAIAKKAAEESSGADNKEASSSNTDSVMADAEPASNASADDKGDQPKVFFIIQHLFHVVSFLILDAHIIVY